MTRDRDFKALVRDHQRRTGQAYTAARADLLAQRPPLTDDPAPTADARPEGAAAFEAARAQQERLVAHWFRQGRLTDIPARRRVRAGVLLQLVTLFRPGTSYPEREVNRILGAVHPDTAYLRRELVNYGYLQRADGTYWLPSSAPERGPVLAAEVPDWEAQWLPSYLAGEAG